MRPRNVPAAALRAMVVATIMIVATTLTTTALADPTTPAVRTSPNPSSTQNSLLAVTAVSGTSAWAVGYYTDDSTGAQDTLIVHWDGHTWTQQTSVNPSSTQNLLAGVRAVNATNVWAVGYYRNDGTGAFDTLVEHWNGSIWSQTPTPNPSSTQNYLGAVNGGGPQGGVWAVGRYQHDGSATILTLTLHWNGSHWEQIASPSPDPSGNALNGVREPGPTNAWAVGQEDHKTLIIHWNGTKWSRVASPSPGHDDALYSTSGSSPANGWAVGEADFPSVDDTLALHWNGTKWSRVTSPNPSSTVNVLLGVTAASTGNPWAVGNYLVGSVQETLIVHWNGTHWVQQ